MKKIFFTLIAIFVLQHLSIAQLTIAPDGGNKKATVGERIGITDITVNYDRPGVKGRDGKIWGGLVPYGYNDLGFGPSKEAPWRAGANENTTISFSNDVSIDGNPMPAGKYALFIALGKEESTIIFSKNNSAWGSFFYDPKEDALRIKVKQQPMEKSVEWLKYEFINQTPNSATVALEWEKLMFTFKIEVDLNKIQLASFRKELQSNKGFEWQAWADAASWCADNKINLEEAINWADYGITGRFVGEKNFRTLSVKARLLSLTGKNEEADQLMKEAMPMGNMFQIHGYARQLMGAKKMKEAAEAFRTNYKKYPNLFTTNMGMMRAFSSEGNFKEALKYANAALLQAPDPGNKTFVEGVVEKLKAGKDVN